MRPDLHPIHLKKSVAPFDLDSYIFVAKGRTNTELREQFTLADGASQSRATFSSRRHPSGKMSTAGSDAGYSSGGSSTAGEFPPSSTKKRIPSVIIITIHVPIVLSSLDLIQCTKNAHCVQSITTECRIRFGNDG